MVETFKSQPPGELEVQVKLGIFERETIGGSPRRQVTRCEGVQVSAGDESIKYWAGVDYPEGHYSNILEELRRLADQNIPYDELAGRVDDFLCDLD
ncbi:hypothetical protein J4410_06625 [Candidatus Woesearchaeota archaeon]|nr:hypothetical protein [Candidatus Woesearchaeota archaeon]